VLLLRREGLLEAGLAVLLLPLSYLPLLHFERMAACVASPLLLV
jgi:hypothetical protein